MRDLIDRLKSDVAVPAWAVALLAFSWFGVTACFWIQTWRLWSATR